MASISSTLSACGLLGLVAACGGGEPAAIVASNLPAQFRPTVYTADGRTLNSCSLDAACSGNPLAPFFAVTSMAPVTGAAVSGLVRLEVLGNELANVELLPAAAGSPRLGVFAISADMTRAWLDFDTASLSTGPVDVKISAFNLPAGQPGASEIIAMPARRWNIGAAATPAPPPATVEPAAANDASGSPISGAVTIAPAHDALLSGVTRLEVRGTGLRNVELLPPTGYAPRLGSFDVSFDGSFAWLDFDTSLLPNGPLEARISAFNASAGQPASREIIVMPARRWRLQH